MKGRQQWPHSPDVLERETADNGFSKGWGMHFAPSAEYYADMHGHMQFGDPQSAGDTVRAYLDRVKQLNIRKIAACSPVMVAEADRNRPQGFSVAILSAIEELAPYFSLARQNSRLSMMLFMHYRNPDLKLLKKSIDMGACAVKLHNAPLIVEGASPDCWLGERWGAVFKEIGRAGLPVLWHVTQRLTASPYTGGGKNTYWDEGWKKGVRYTNEDLLQVFLKVVREYPGISFITAHQLHLGWERLGNLMDQHANLYTDTSIGCFVQDGDQIYGADRRLIRDFFIRYSDRILFGTDYFLKDVTGSHGNGDAADMAAIAGHIRFIRQLRLPHGELQQVSHANAERLLNMRAQ